MAVAGRVLLLHATIAKTRQTLQARCFLFPWSICLPFLSSCCSFQDSRAYKARRTEGLECGCTPLVQLLIPAASSTQPLSRSVIADLYTRVLSYVFKMPRQAADLEEALNKKGGLTLSQLANYDDIITDALVDRVC